MEENGTLLVLVLVVFLVFSGMLGGTPLNQRPPARGNPGPAAGIPNSQLAGAGIAGGTDLVTGNYAGAATLAYQAVKSPNVQKAAWGAFKAPADVIGGAAASVAHTLSKLNPF